MKQRVYRNFGTPHPEGYRKALRVMQVAEKFRRPIFTLVDTDGAYPGIHAEERGQAEAIAHNLREMARLEVPIIATVIGVGGSGGALAIAVADRVLMMENSIYSVISPEGCAAIMWRDATKKELAAEAMRITATDLSELGCIDDIVPEPEGGAHRDYEAAANLLDVSLQKHFSELKKLLRTNYSCHDIISSATSLSSSRPNPGRSGCHPLLYQLSFRSFSTRFLPGRRAI
jgi:acetyl-CoA carboxylase carboxyl transferase subunit alpha